MRAPTKSGPCEACGRDVRVDVVRDQIAHAMPVCTAFEAMMQAAGRRDGRVAVVGPSGRMLEPRAMRRARARQR